MAKARQLREGYMWQIVQTEELGIGTVAFHQAEAGSIRGLNQQLWQYSKSWLLECGDRILLLALKVKR